MKRLQELLRPQEYQTIVDTYGDYSLDWDKVFHFAWDLNVENIKYPSPYRLKAIISEIEKGTFTNEPLKPQKRKIINLTNLWNDLRDKEIRCLQKSECYISCLEQYMIDCGIPPDELYNLNHQIVDYLKVGDTTERYYELLKKSQLIKKYNINIQEAEEEAENQWEDWQKIITDLTKDEDEFSYLK